MSEKSNLPPHLIAEESLIVRNLPPHLSSSSCSCPPTMTSLPPGSAAVGGAASSSAAGAEVEIGDDVIVISADDDKSPTCSINVTFSKTQLNGTIKTVKHTIVASKEEVEVESVGKNGKKMKETQTVVVLRAGAGAVGAASVPAEFLGRYQRTSDLTNNTGERTAQKNGFRGLLRLVLAKGTTNTNQRLTMVGVFARNLT